MSKIYNLHHTLEKKTLAVRHVLFVWHSMSFNGLQTWMNIFFFWTDYRFHPWKNVLVAPMAQGNLINNLKLSVLSCDHSSFEFSLTCSLLFVTVRHCSLLFRTVFFSKFQCKFTFAKKIKLYNFVYFRVRHHYFLFRTSCDRDDEKLPLKYIVERIRFYVSLKLEKKQWRTVRWKKVPLKYIVERTAVTVRQNYPCVSRVHCTLGNIACGCTLGSLLLYICFIAAFMYTIQEWHQTGLRREQHTTGEAAVGTALTPLNRWQLTPSQRPPPQPASAPPSPAGYTTSPLLLNSVCWRQQKRCVTQTVRMLAPKRSWRLILLFIVGTWVVFQVCSFAVRIQN